MKKLMLLTVMMAAVLTIDAQTARQEDMKFDLPEVDVTAAYLNSDDDLAKKLAAIKGVESVFISKTMLGLAGSLGNKIPKESIGKLDHIHIFDAEGKAAAQKLRATAEKHMKDNKYEVLMETRDDDEFVTIQMKKGKSGHNEYVLLTIDEDDDATVIILTGNITEKDLKGLNGMF